MRDIPRQQIGLIVALGCCKAVLLKATIQLHCIPVKGKEELPFSVQRSGFRGSKHRAESIAHRAKDITQRV
jgi:hypothetical protein